MVGAKITLRQKPANFQELRINHQIQLTPQLSLLQTILLKLNPAIKIVKEAFRLYKNLPREIRLAPPKAITLTLEVANVRFAR